MYFAMTAICFLVTSETSNLNISDGLFLLVLGGIGMVIPSPGGVGTYHFCNDRPCCIKFQRYSPW